MSGPMPTETIQLSSGPGPGKQPEPSECVEGFTQPSPMGSPDQRTKPSSCRKAGSRPHVGHSGRTQVGGSKETQPRSLRPVLGEGGTRTRTTGGRFGSEFLAPAAIHSARRLCQVVSSPSLGVHARPGWPPVRDSAERVSEGRCQVGMDTGLSLLLPPAV